MCGIENKLDSEWKALKTKPIGHYKESSMQTCSLSSVNLGNKELKAFCTIIAVGLLSGWSFSIGFVNCNNSGT